MWLKAALAILFVCSLLAASALLPLTKRTTPADSDDDSSGERLRLLSWNIGNGDLESETRAHTEDLPSVARVILDHDPDVVALQELRGTVQLNFLLRQLENRYQGFLNSPGDKDRVEALLVRRKSSAANGNIRNVVFSDIPTGKSFAPAATFRVHKDSPEIIVVSVHADAFNAAARREFVGDVVDWCRQADGKIAFIAGDFNLEVGTRNRNNLFTDDAKHDSESYAYLLRYFTDLGGSAGQTSVNERRIDYVFGSATKVSLHRAEVLREAAVGHMDHWPLLVEVGL